MDDDGVEVAAHALAAALLDHEAVAGGTRHKANG